MAATHVVKALSLNLRSSPSPTAPRVAVLPQGTPVTKVADASLAGWFEVDASLQGATAHGFLNASFLAPAGTTFPVVTPAGGAIPPADLGRTPSAKRDSRGSLAFGIGEPGRPGPAAANPGGSAAGIIAVIDFLDVGDTDHVRWQPTSSSTFCNVYCYDVCNIAGAYLPRVWWKPAALAKLRAGQQVDVKYDVTVFEIRANELFNWFGDFGADFGWSRVMDLDELQSAANAGKIGIIVAQRTELNRPGHIQVVAPEHGTHKASRTSSGKVKLPLQSNAGASTFTYGFLGNSAWWRAASFRDFAFWVCQPS
jgi:hypothetical protein